MRSDTYSEEEAKDRLEGPWMRTTSDLIKDTGPTKEVGQNRRLILICGIALVLLIALGSFLLVTKRSRPLLQASEIINAGFYLYEISDAYEDKHNWQLEVSIESTTKQCDP